MGACRVGALRWDGGLPRGGAPLGWGPAAWGRSAGMGACRVGALRWDGGLPRGGAPLGWGPAAWGRSAGMGACRVGALRWDGGLPRGGAPLGWGPAAWGRSAGMGACRVGALRWDGGLPRGGAPLGWGPAAWGRWQAACCWLRAAGGVAGRCVGLCVRPRPGGVSWPGCRGRLRPEQGRAEPAAVRGCGWLPGGPRGAWRGLGRYGWARLSGTAADPEQGRAAGPGRAARIKQGAGGG